MFFNRCFKFNIYVKHFIYTLWIKSYPFLMDIYFWYHAWTLFSFSFFTFFCKYLGTILRMVLMKILIEIH